MNRSIIAATIIITMMLSGTVFAAEATRSLNSTPIVTMKVDNTVQTPWFALNTKSTDDSTLVLTGQSTNSVFVTVVKVMKDDAGKTAMNWSQGRNFSFEPVEGQINNKIYLAYSPGRYYVLVSSKNPGEDHLSNKLTDVDIINTDERLGLDLLLPDDQIESDNPEIVAAAQEITKNLATDYQKVSAIHDWVAKNITFDLASSRNLEYKQFSALETFNTKKAVCNGYAKLTVALCRAAGIKAKYIGGTFSLNLKRDKGINSHGWAEAWADNRWVVIDTTADAGYENANTHKFEFHFNRKYFDPSPSVFAKEHYKISENWYSFGK